MDLKKHNRQITLLCQICGNDQFKGLLENGDINSIVECTSCGKTQTKDSLIQENKGAIDSHVKDMIPNIIKEIKKSLKLKL